MTDKEQFHSIEMQYLVPEVPLPGDVYLLLNDKFLKYKNAGDIFPADKYNDFIFKKVVAVYCQKEESAIFADWFRKYKSKAHEQLLTAVGSKNKDLVDQREEIRDELFKIFSGEVTDEKCRQVMEKTRKFIELVSSRKSSQGILHRLTNYNPSIAEHSVNVATLSVYLCYNLGYNHQLILENVYMGSLLHDFGKTKIDPKLLENVDEVEYARVMKTHCELGRAALMEMTSLPLEVVKIVAEHHENHDGSGYPKKLRGGRIYELAKIVSIANEFDNHASTFKGTNKDKQKHAISILEKDKSERFDPKKLEKCLEVLRLGL